MKSPASSDRLTAVLVAVLFMVLALMTGRVFRYPFDDEIFSLNLLESARGFWPLCSDLLHAIDVHPPASYLVFYAAWQLGAREHALHFLSLAFSALAVALAYRILCLMTQGAAAWTSASRAFVVIVLVSTPLVLSQGDAIRWYPLFTLLYLASVHAYLREAPSSLGLGSAALVGLAASTNYLGFLVYPWFELDRLLRSGWRIDWKGIPLRALTFAVLAAPGLITLWNGLTHGAHQYVEGQIGGGVLGAAVSTGIGFFGGNSLGVIQAIGCLPMVFLSIVVLYQTLRNPRTRILALNILVLLGLIAVGFAKPRSFVYLALSATILVGYCWVTVADGKLKLAIGLIALATPLGVIANIKWNDTPYKRNAMLPVEEILRFAAANSAPGDVIIVSDVVLNWELRHDSAACISLYLANTSCPFAGASRLLVIDGYALGSAERDDWLRRKDALLAGRAPVATVYFGVDHEAWLKRRLVPGLDDYLQRAVVYTK
jgi:hypothetical protein